MKKLTNLNKEIKTLNNLAIIGMDGKTPMTFKSALISICELHRPKKAGTGEAIKAFTLGSKFQEAKDDIQLEETDIEFLKKIINETEVYVAVIVGRLIQFLDGELKAD